MTADGGDDFSKLTFAQREGKAPLPEAMELGHVPQKFRQLAWLSIDEEIGDLARMGDIDDFYEGHPVRGIAQIIWSFKFEIKLIPHDKIPHPKPSIDRKLCREIVLYGQYDKVLTLVEYILRHEECSSDLHLAIEQAFAQTSIAYFVEKIGDIPTIIPRITCDAGEATRQSIETLNANRMDGATTHLRQAAEHINAKQYADSIADSIHAVESVARVIAPGARRNLSAALDSLESVGRLKHPKLKEAFKKLYHYTSDEQGIRHALLEKDSADVGLDEAVFMFGACASFAAYLTQKQRQAGGA
ncbi:MAG: hypothetical protein OXQ89_12650 [Rhodospirillaceae bacterium]|nr:hypothetical protein [Rhodospirillaceae bacterium]